MRRRRLTGAFRWLLGREPTITRAGMALASATLTVALLAGLLMRLVDPDGFPNVWRGLWWAVQTVTTVGYGDAVPSTVAGRLVASVVMLAGIAFISVLTATTAAAFVETARRRLEREDPTDVKIEELRKQIESLEALIRSRPT
ncbi:MAG TPA: potassium channel family protein [Gaiellaceae bacterium]